ncbi:MAG: hypothetical protein HZB53_19120 [Chloroflexi bacterium]|nr:hypothetical protein [Chloroflexota bacterium]
MNEIVRLELPEDTARRAKAIALHSHRRFEDLLVEWINRAASESSVDTLPDDQLLSLCDLQMAPDQQTELSDLLERNRERSLRPGDEQRLDELMRIYRHGMARKAQAWRVAVQRGLRPPLN